MPFLRGTALALLSALAFGVTAPLVKRFGVDVGPFTTAALLYVGAALVTAVARRPAGEAPLSRVHALRLVFVALLGAAVAPALLAWGLQRTSALAGSLLLNLEAPFTVVLGRVVAREHVGRRAAVAAVLLAAGGAAVGLDATHVDAASSSSIAAARPDLTIGALAVAAATLAWALDNTVGKPLADLHAPSVVRAKAGIGALLSITCALVVGEHAPAAGPAFALLVCGATGYGASLLLYLRAQREIGSARTGSVFAFAPFVGALVAVGEGERGAGLGAAFGAAVMLAGVVMHLSERHEHAHAHEPVEHEHAHRHDDGHHDHTHDVLPAGEHTHRHRHDRVVHSHPHAVDADHRHEH